MCSCFNLHDLVLPSNQTITRGHLAIGHLTITICQPFFFLRANTTELHPKVSPTFLLIFYDCP